MADLPGLIEGASDGVGLGHEFLRHIERTKVMIHMVDAAGTEGRDPVADIKAINKELEAYNPQLLKKPQVIAANKIDAIAGDENEVISALRAEFEPQGIKVFPISPSLLAPLLVKSVRWSEELSIAMESKGFSAKAERTDAMPIQIHKRDVAFTVLCCLILPATAILTH